jgi:hypothetical protein
MATFVVNVWHEFTSDEAFERTIPLALNGRRMARLGLANPIQLVFLKGLDRLSERYRAELRDLGYRIHDAEPLVDELAPMLAIFAERWQSWGRIKHYCLMRFPVMRRLFPGTALVTFDGDMIVNAPFADIAAALDSGLFLLGGSSCFAAIPADGDFFAVLEDQMAAIARDPDAYARDVAGLRSAAEFFDPRILRGSDQGLIALLVKRGLLRLGHGRQAIEDAGMLGFANLMRLHLQKVQRLDYARRDGVDFLGGRKVMIWHMSAGVCNHLGHYAFLRDWLGEEAVRLFGRVPSVPPPAGAPEADADLAALLVRAKRVSRHFDLRGAIDRDPYSRSRVCRTFFEESDFAFALNDASWHAPGLFAPPVA